MGYASHAAELTELVAHGVVEVLLGCQALSRLGTLSLSELEGLARQARMSGLRPVLEWDILMTEVPFERALAALREIDLSLFSAIRVQDPGAFGWVLEHYPEHPIQLVLETGNHNLAGVQRWCELGGSRLERLVLSIELPRASLAEMIRGTKVPVEVLGLGPILLLYTPRHLLSNQLGDRGDMDRRIEALASSEESQHSGFRLIENENGTFVFHAKDYCLLDRIEELREMGLAALRVDLRLGGTWGGWQKGEHPVAVTQCFFRANATDVLFKKLKNNETQRQDEGYVGEVVEITKDSHSVIAILGKGCVLNRGDQLLFVTPERRRVEWVVQSLRNLEGVEVDQVFSGDFAVVSYLKTVIPKTAVYWSDRQKED